MVQAIPAVFQYAAVAATVVSAGVSAYSSYKAGQAQAAYYAGEARAAETEARQAKLQATQISAQRMEELNSNLSAIMAARAGKNLAGDSPTEMAITRSFTRESLRSKSNEVLDARLRRLGAINAKASATSSAKAAQTAGLLGAIEGTADAVARFSNIIPRRAPVKRKPSGSTTSGGGRVGTGPG